MHESIKEIHGKKFLVREDPTLQRVEEYRVGDQVMVLKKKYGNSYEMCPGVIVGFYEFVGLPTIHIAYLNVDYNTAKIEFLAFNEKTEDEEFCRYEGKALPYGKDRVMTLLNNEIDKKTEELAQLKHKQQYFVECFGQYFEAMRTEA